MFIEHTRVPDPDLGLCVDRTVMELYDRAGDPFEMRNLAAPGYGTPQSDAELERLSRLTDELRDCAGIEGRDPVPASGHYCS